MFIIYLFTSFGCKIALALLMEKIIPSSLNCRGGVFVLNKWPHMCGSLWLIFIMKIVRNSSEL